MVHYSLALRVLHWLTVLGLLFAYSSIELKSLFEWTLGQRKVVVLTHVYAGVTVFVMMVSRLVLRLGQRPAATQQQTSWQHRIAHWVHGVLYTLFILLPLLSITARYFRGRAWSLFGIPMPISQFPDVAIAKAIMEWHVDLANIGYGLIAIHALAALLHHFVLKDNTLRAMLPWSTSGTKSREETL